MKDAWSKRCHSPAEKQMAKHLKKHKQALYTGCGWNESVFRDRRQRFSNLSLCPPTDLGDLGIHSAAHTTSEFWIWVTCTISTLIWTFKDVLKWPFLKALIHSDQAYLIIWKSMIEVLLRILVLQLQWKCRFW